MTGKPRGLPLDDVERLKRWTALVRRQSREIARLRRAAAEAILALQHDERPTRAQIAEWLCEATQRSSTTSQMQALPVEPGGDE